MTPATKDDAGVTLKGHRGKDSKDAKELGIRRRGDAIVFSPSWACSAGTREFTRADALVLVERIELTEAFDAWYAARDSRGYDFAVKLKGGRLYCEQDPRDDDDDGNPAAPHFAWAQFAKSVKARLKDLKPEQA